ncbi:MAG: hypothetical protein JWP75_3538 [Frondihabitans sp.]|nr:hypothetical protein [Frondihabitans sp.]
MAEATGQARKLGLKPGMRVALDGAPDGWALTDPPSGLIAADASAADLIVAFFTTADSIDPRVGDLAQRIFPAGSLWCLWPRRASGHTSDITDVVLREIVLRHGLVDTKVAAVDTDWSGLKFVWRRDARH